MPPLTIGSGRALLYTAGPVVKTYSDFQAMIRARAINGFTSWSSAPAVTALQKNYVSAAAATGIMRGSSWGLSEVGWTRSESVIARIVQHAFPSQAVFDTQVTAGRDIYIETQPDVTGYTFLGAVDRNGYNSLAYSGASITVGIISDLIYWDGTQAMQMQPNLGLGPTPFPF